MNGGAMEPAGFADPTEGLVLESVLPRRYPWRIAGTVVILLLLVLAARSIFANPHFQWPVVAHYMFQWDILDGVLLTIELTITAMLIGTVIGVVVALMGFSPNPLMSRAAALYVAFFRGVPVLVQLLFWYNLAALFPRIELGIPFGPVLLSLNANNVITPLIAANLGLGLCEGAFMAEIVRSGILSVDRGQAEAAMAIGMTRRQAMWRIILPQAMRVIVPPTGNEVIGMMKYTSLASVISVTELLASAELIYTRTFETIPLLIVASIWYIGLTALLSVVQRAIERRFARSDRDTGASRGRRLRDWRIRRSLAAPAGMASP
jgi:polar amino acid transport system permease protein